MNIFDGGQSVVKATTLKYASPGLRVLLGLGVVEVIEYPSRHPCRLPVCSRRRMAPLSETPKQGSNP